MFGAQFRAQHRADAGLIAFPARLEPIDDVGIEAEEFGLRDDDFQIGVGEIVTLE